MYVKIPNYEREKKIYVLVKITKNITECYVDLVLLDIHSVIYSDIQSEVYVCMYVWVTENVKDKFI